MSTPASLEAALNAPERVEPLEPAPAPVIPPDAPLNVEDDAAVDAALQANAIQVPDGDALVSHKTAGEIGQAYRAKLKEARAERDALKEGSAKIPQLEQQIAQLTQTVQQLQPYVQAYQAIQQQQPPAEPKAPEIPDHEAEAYARTYDLYKPDGSGQLDLDRGRKIVTDMRRIATEAAETAAAKHVAPIQQQTAQSQAHYMMERAKTTVRNLGITTDELPDTMLAQVWNRLPPEQASDPQAAQWLLAAAWGAQDLMRRMQSRGQQSAPPAPAQAQRGPNGQFQPAQAGPIPDPVPREPAGGQPPNAPTQLTDQEQKFLSQTGMSEADYLKTAGARYGGR